MATRKKTARSGAKKNTAAQMSARRQMQSVILLAVAVLILCMAIIPGEHVWTWLHLALLGVFSFSAYVLPVVLGFVAFMLALEKDSGSITARIWESVAFVIMLDSVIYAFTTNSDTMGYFPAIADSFTRGKTVHGGGVLGVILGYPAEKLFGDTGAKIIIILLMAVFFMLVTGTTLLALLRAARKPVEKTRESIENAITLSAERRQAAEQNRQIDIDLGDGYGTTGSKPGRRKKASAVVQEPLDAPAEEIPLPPDSEAPADARSDKLDAFEQAAKGLQNPVEEPAAAEKPAAIPAGEVDKATAEVADEVRQQEAHAPGEESYRFPPLSLLNAAKKTADRRENDADTQANGRLLVSTLKDFGINTKLTNVTYGPAVTRYELEPSAGVKISRITGLSDDIALRLATTGVRIEAPIPNKAAVGIEVPNKARMTVCLRELLDTGDYRTAKGRLTVALGKDIEGNIVLTDLAKMPHLLIAGTTGSGKSVCTNSMIQSVLFHARPDEVKMILIDPKQVEFGVYNGVPHLLVPVVTDPRKAAGALSWAVNEMLKRYKTFAENNVRDLTSYNELAQQSDTMRPMPLILIVIDELSDLMMAAANEVEDSICRLAQMARAAGMHMVIATQRPSVDVITGLIKANIPSRLALTVASAVDSRTILDTGGADRLLGYGDMLFMPVGQAKPRRVQGCFVSNDEVERVVAFLKNAGDEQEYDQTIIEEIDKQAAATGKAGGHPETGEDGGDDDTDEALPQAIEIAVEAGQISTSMLQRKMRFGYARAGRIIDQMEQRGIIGPSEGSKPRKVLITRQQWIEMNMNQSDDT